MTCAFGRVVPDVLRVVEVDGRVVVDEARVVVVDDAGRTAKTSVGYTIGKPAADAGAPKKVLFFSKSSGFEHSAIKRKGDQPSFAEQILAELGPKHGFTFTFSKDGSLFTPEYLAQFDAFFFYTTGDLTTPGTDKNPPMSAAGKQAFLDAIKNGKGYLGTHSASDTFHSKESGGGNPEILRAIISEGGPRMPAFKSDS